MATDYEPRMTEAAHIGLVNAWYGNLLLVTGFVLMFLAGWTGFEWLALAGASLFGVGALYFVVSLVYRRLPWRFEEWAESFLRRVFDAR